MPAQLASGKKKNIAERRIHQENPSFAFLCFFYFFMKNIKKVEKA